MSRVLKTSTMKSALLVAWLTGSLTGGWVSSAIWRGPGAAALGFGAAGTASAGAGAAIAAALASVAPLRKLRRAMADESFFELPARFDMRRSPDCVRRCKASTRVLIGLESRARPDGSQAGSIVDRRPLRRAGCSALGTHAAQEFPGRHRRQAADHAAEVARHLDAEQPVPDEPGEKARQQHDRERDQHSQPERHGRS